VVYIGDDMIAVRRKNFSKDVREKILVEGVNLNESLKVSEVEDDLIISQMFDFGNMNEWMIEELKCLFADNFLCNTVAYLINQGNVKEGVYTPNRTTHEKKREFMVSTLWVAVCEGIRLRGCKVN
jgi:hypothetical protein